MHDRLHVSEIPSCILYSCYCHFCDLLHILCSIVIFHDIFFQVMAFSIQIGTGVFLYYTPITVCIPLNSLEALKFTSERPMVACGLVVFDMTVFGRTNY